MSEALERAKSRTLKELYPVLSGTFLSSLSSWRMDSIVREYAALDPVRVQEIGELIKWCLEDQKRLQVFIATRSPSTAADLSLRYSIRLCPEAEKIVTDKAKDRPKLLEYCGRWGIIISDMTKVTMKAAFDPESKRETAYIKKLEHTKKKIKEFLEQMVSNGMMDSGTTVKELIETL